MLRRILVKLLVSKENQSTLNIQEKRPSHLHRKITFNFNSNAFEPEENYLFKIHKMGNVSLGSN